MNNEEKIVLVAGIINATNTMLYWIDRVGAEIGDYLLVENKNGYDLIKVIGIVTTTKKGAQMLSKTKYENMKRTVLKLHKEIFEKKQNNQE